MTSLNKKNISRIVIYSFIFILTFYFIDNNVREEFNLFSFPEYNILWYLLSVIILTILAKKLIKKWIIMPVLLSILLFTLSYSFSRTIAYNLNRYNIDRIEQIKVSDKSEIKNNTVYLYYGLVPTSYRLFDFTDISIKDLGGRIQTYNAKSRLWTFND
jgi:hypothetical protein